MMASGNDDTPASTSVASSSPSHNFQDILVNAFPAYGSTFASTSAAPQPTRSGRVPHPPPEEELASMLAMDNYFEFPSEDETDDEDFVLPPAEEEDDLEDFLLQFGQELPPLPPEPPTSPKGKRKADTTPPPPSRRSKKDEPAAKRAKVPPLSPGSKAAIRRQRNADQSKAHRERQKEKEQELKIRVEELTRENEELKQKLAEAQGRQFSLEDVGKLMAVVMKGSSGSSS